MYISLVCEYFKFVALAKGVVALANSVVAVDVTLFLTLCSSSPNFCRKNGVSEGVAIYLVAPSCLII